MSDSIQETTAISDAAIRAIVDSVSNAQQTTIRYESVHADQGNDLSVFVIVLTAVVFGTFFFLMWLNGRYWDRGIFPPFLRFRKGNYYRAVINLATNILRCDADQRPEKMNLLRRFMAKKFPDAGESVLKSVTDAANLPVTASSTARWLGKHLKSEAEKEQILDLLLEMAVADGALGEKEYALLAAYTKHVGLDPNQFEDRLLKIRTTNGIHP